VLCFAANWSDESKHMLEIVSLLSQEEKNKSLIRFLEIEAEDYEDLSVKYGIEVVPTFIFIKVDVYLK
jgi:thioredoxin-related protein